MTRGVAFFHSSLLPGLLEDAARKFRRFAAMDPASAAALKESIYAFYEAYEGKKPSFADHKHK